MSDGNNLVMAQFVLKKNSTKLYLEMNGKLE